MSTAQVFDVAIYEDSGASFMARVVGPDGTNIVQADISAITYTIYDKNDLSSSTATGSLTVASVVYNTLQTDDRWTVDGTGYNFRWDAAASLFPTGNTVYRVQFVFDPVTGEDFPLLFNATTIDLLGQ